MTQASEQIAKQYTEAGLNKKNWGTAMYNVLVEGLVGGGVTDDTVALQALVNTAITAGRKAIFFPHGTYYVTALTNANQVTFFGDNASFVGGYTGEILQLGEGGVTQAEFDAHLAEFTQLKDEAVTAINAVTGYDADPTGVLDSTTELQAAATAATGKTLFIPPGDYLISSTITIPAATTVIAYGARIFNTATHITLITPNSGVKIFGLELQGAGNSVYDANGIGINFSGADSSNYKDGLTVEDCYIHGFGANGIYAEFAKNIYVDRNKVYNIGYGGVFGLSVTNMNVRNNHVKGMSPGTSGNAYNVSFTRKTVTTSLVTYPNSKDCTVENNLIEDNLIWNGLDTHGGQNIKFIDNTLRNCKFGIWAVPSGNYAPNHIEISGNSVYGIATGTGAGILVKGAPNTPGSPFEFAEACIVRGNIAIDCGLEGTADNGALFFEQTRNLVVAMNTIVHAFVHAINLYQTNHGFNITGNNIIDPQSNSQVTASGIVIRAGYANGYIGGNTLLRVNDAYNTNVAERGINISSATSVDIMLGANQNNFVLEFSGVTGAIVRFGALGNGVYDFVGSGTPEAVITAGIGSTYRNLAGGAATTLYVKTTGTGNTGWTAK